MNLFCLQPWIFSLSGGKKSIRTRADKQKLVIYFLWRLVFSNDVIIPSFGPPPRFSQRYHLLLFCFLHLIPSPPTLEHSPSLPPFTCLLLPLFFTPAAHFEIYEFLSIIFLNFFFFFLNFHAAGRHSHSSPSLFSHFLPPERICQTGCEVTVWPMEVRVGCGWKCVLVLATRWRHEYKFHWKVGSFSESEGEHLVAIVKVWECSIYPQW